MRSVDLHLVPGSASDARTGRTNRPDRVASSRHAVEFYENDAFLAASVADFVADGLAVRDPVVVLATAAHRRAFERRLRAKGVDLTAARQDGLLTWCDADAVLARVMEDGLPDEDRFHAELEPLLQRAALRRHDGVVRAHAELADVLWQRGETAAALRLEELWSALAHRHHLALRCAYAAEAFAGVEGVAGREAVCERHDHLHKHAAPADDEPADGGAPVFDDEEPEPDAERDLLHRHVRALAAEVAQRRFLEQQLRAALAERRAAERELRRSREQLAEAQQLARLGSWASVPETGAAEWSDELWRLLGLAPGAITPSLDRLLASVHPDDGPDLRLLLQRVLVAADLGEVAPESREVRVRRPDGTVRHCEFRVHVTPRTAEHPPALHGTLRDVTERRTAEAERRALEARLLETQRLETIGVLAGGIAHDFNNLLTTVVGNADLLQTGMHAGTAEFELADEILLAGRRSADLTRQLLAYAGHASHVVRELDLGALAREVGALLRTAMPAGGALRLETPGAGALVAGDRAQLTQVLMNLVTNAAEALTTDGGEVVVRVCTREAGPDAAEALAAGGLAGTAPTLAGPCVRVEVVDTGGGMTEQVRARMFEPFFSTKVAGRGLGLAATLGIVRAHRGALAVRSAPGTGTTVTIWLPATTASTSATAARGTPVASAAMRPRVLLLDDDAAVRATLARMLGRLGCEVVEAPDAAAAIALVAGDAPPPDLAIVDATMPDASGEATATRLAALRPTLPVLLTSGYCDGERAFGAPGAPGRRVLPKPYDMATLERIVGEALRGGAHAPA